MKIAKFAVLLSLAVAAASGAQPAPPAAPKPCVLMPRQGPALPPAAERPRERCATAAFPRSER